MSWKRNWMEDVVYADVGDKLNFAACVSENKKLTFVGWIRKFCCEAGTKVKATKEELGI